jgi:hypothetical protein
MRGRSDHEEGRACRRNAGAQYGTQLGSHCRRAMMRDAMVRDAIGAHDHPWLG